MTTTKKFNKLLDTPKSISFWQSALLRFVKNKLALFSLAIIIVLTLMCIFIPLISQYSYSATKFDNSLVAPNISHLFGTDNLGRDLFVRCFIGGRVTFEIAFAATLVILVFGVLYGSISGFIGGKLDILMMRIVDILYGIPFLFFCILLLTVFGQRIFLTLIAITALAWLDMARVVRGQALSLKQKEFIEAALISGVSKIKIITRHIIPNLIGIVIIYAALVIPNMITLSAILSFFGLGIMEPMTSWGLLISDGTQNIDSWWLLLFPASLMVITLLAFAFIANGLRDSLDPK